MLSHDTIIAEITRKIKDLRTSGLPMYINRDVPLLIADRLVSVLVGSRRSGKSFRSYQEAQDLIQSGWLKDISSVCIIDFDNPHLGSMQATDLFLIRDTFLRITPGTDPETHLLFIFDEIHRIEGWEDFVVEISRNPNWRVLVTGSSSRMLKTDISTTLRGKSLSTVIYPLSFKEFLGFRGIRSADSTEERAMAMSAFDEYLRWGGFPQVAQTSEMVREALLREYFDTMILKDIIQRHNVSRPAQCIAVYRYLLSLAARPFTRNSISAFLHESGFTATQSHIADYLEWADDSWFLFGVTVFSDSLREINRNYRKSYCLDWGLAIQNSPSWDGGYSRAFENMVYMHLRRIYPRVHYYLTRSERQEVDFVCVDSRGTPVLAVQACLKIGDGSVLSREVPPLAAVARYFGIKDALIVSSEDERTITSGDVTVRIVPAWRWMNPVV